MSPRLRSQGFLSLSRLRSCLNQAGSHYSTSKMGGGMGEKRASGKKGFKEDGKSQTEYGHYGMVWSFIVLFSFLFSRLEDKIVWSCSGKSPT